MPSKPLINHCSPTLAGRGAFLVLLCGCWLASAAQAHEIRPAVAELAIDGRQAIIELRINLEAQLARIGPDHEDSDDSPNAQDYKRLRKLAPAGLRSRLDAVQVQWLDSITLSDANGTRLPLTLTRADIPAVGDIRLPRDTRLALAAPLAETTRFVQWQWSEDNGSLILRSGADDAPDAYSALLSPGQLSQPIAVAGHTAPTSLPQVVTDYMWSGIVHIVPRGLDHILFVIGLFLLAPRFRPVIWQVSCFTVAHSITLALATLGLVSVSASIVEPLIALSIAAIGIENLFSRQLHRWRMLIVFGFGLLHGLGFASVLAEVGLGGGRYLSALLAFNVGVELGQLAVILACFALLGWPLRERAWYRRAITVPGSLTIAAIGLYWFATRI